MLRAPLLAVCTIVVIGCPALAPPARAQAPLDAGVVGEMPLPGGIRAALATLDDPLTPDRSQFLLEVIRRAYGSNETAATDAGVQRLIVHLERAGNDANADTLPLPLAPDIWTKVVFANAPPAPSLPLAILRSRDAARFYCALLSLDDQTRAWLTTQPRLLAELSSQQSAAFLVAAPGLRVDGRGVRLPGGDAARPGWEAIVDRRVGDPAAFVRALLQDDDGRNAYLVAAAAELTTAQVRFLLGADAADPKRRVESAKRMAAAFRRTTAGWSPDQWPFWRPAFDPVSLVAELPVDGQGRPALPGTQRFWEAVLRGSSDRSDTGPVDVAWLCEQIFSLGPIQGRAIYDAILFASRRLPAGGQGGGDEAVATVRGAVRFPALVMTLERAGLDDLRAYAAAVRRARRLSSIRNPSVGTRVLAQYQGALAIVIGAALHGGIDPGGLSGLVTSLSAVDVDENGEFDGRLVRWMKANLSQDLVPLLAGRGPTPRVEWEGTQYRLDFAAAESARLRRLLDDEQFPALETARALVDIADDLERPSLTREQVQRHAAALTRLALVLPPEEAARVRATLRPLERIEKDGNLKDASRQAPPLVAVADGVFARGLRHAAYAAVFRQPDVDPSLVADVAARHLFGPAPDPTALAWALPIAGGDPTLGWHATGSLLGLDSALAYLSLVRLSAVPPSRAPSLDGGDRRVLIENAALVDPRALTDADRDAIVAAVRRGRERVAALRTAADVASLADDIRMSPARRTLLAWTLAHDPARVASFLAPVEWLWAGTPDMPAGFQAWGAPAGPRLGCACVRLPAARRLESFCGRWSTGVLASGFPDLNLRLAELLADLRMPAAVLAPLLPLASADLVDRAVSRDHDDRRGLQEYVAALTRERVEEYLAYLTAGGPLVPVAGAGTGTSGTGVWK